MPHSAGRMPMPSMYISTAGHGPSPTSLGRKTWAGQRPSSVSISIAVIRDLYRGRGESRHAGASAYYFFLTGATGCGGGGGGAACTGATGCAAGGGGGVGAGAGATGGAAGGGAAGGATGAPGG